MTTKPTIPIGWKRIRSSDVLDIRDGTHESPKKIDSGGVPLLTSKNIVNGELSFHRFYCISDNDAAQVNKRSRVQKGDILVSMIGTVGESALIMQTPSFVVKNVGIFKENEEKILSRFLIKQLHSEQMRNIIKSRLNGGIQKFIGLGDLRKLPLLLPPLPEQSRIVAILETWDQALELLKKKIKLKKGLKKGLMQQLLTGKKRLPGFEEKWMAVKLGDISKIYDGTHQTPKYVESGIPFYSVEHITANQFSSTKFISEDVYRKEIKRAKIERGDILMTRIGNIGTARFINWNVQASFYVTLALIKVFETINPQFLTHAINSDEFQREIWSKTIHVAFPNKINLGDINKCRITIPKSPREQAAIAQVLTTADGEIEALQKKKQLLEDQKTYLLNHLVTGKIRTPQNLTLKS
jgi:type I restriction enzyme, S subunit